MLACTLTSVIQVAAWHWTISTKTVAAVWTVVAVCEFFAHLLEDFWRQRKNQTKVMFSGWTDCDILQMCLSFHCRQFTTDDFNCITWKNLFLCALILNWCLPPKQENSESNRLGSCSCHSHSSTNNQTLGNQK